MSVAKKSYRCPECHGSDGLWQDVTFGGWEEVDATLTPTGKRDVGVYDVVDRYDRGGCTCGWEGSFAALEAVGLDGQPLPSVHPAQTQIEVPA